MPSSYCVTIIYVICDSDMGAVVHHRPINVIS